MLARILPCLERGVTIRALRCGVFRRHGSASESATMSNGVTELLARVSRGDRLAVTQLLESVYAELRALADSYLQQERTGHTLQATALVHEAYLKLVDRSQMRWQDRAHFCAAAAQAMRRILIDHARTRKRQKRHTGRKLSLDTALLIAY